MEENKDSRENEIAALKQEIERLKGGLVDGKAKVLFEFERVDAIDDIPEYWIAVFTPVKGMVVQAETLEKAIEELATSIKVNLLYEHRKLHGAARP